MPVVSVILPVYNAEKLISRTIQSVLDQSFIDLELIIINDGSTDSTENICNRIKQLDKRIKVFSQKNSGVSKARNLGISKSSGDYIAFIDADDFYESNYIKNMIQATRQYDSDLVICGYKMHIKDRSLNFTPEQANMTNIQEFIEKYQPVLFFNQPWNKLYKSDIIKKHNLLMDPLIDLGEDAIFNIEYCKFIKKVSIISDTLYNYNISDSGLGFKYRKNSGELKLKIFYKLRELYSLKKFKTPYIEKNILKQYISWSSDIVNPKNTDRLREKISSLKSITKSDQFKRDLDNTSSFIIKLCLRLFYISPISYLIGKLAGIYHIKKRRKLFRGDIK